MSKGPAGGGLLQSILRAVGIRAVSEADISFEQRRSALAAALNPKRDPEPEPSVYRWIRDLYDDFLIYEEGEKCYRASYAIADDGTVTIGEATEVVQKITYEPVVTEADTSADQKCAVCGKTKAAHDAAGMDHQYKPTPMESAIALEGDLVTLEEKAVRRDGTVDVFVIKPGWGSSGYYGSDMLRRDGEKAFPAGTHMFMDHPTESQDRERPERSVRDLGGVTLTPAHWKDEGWNGPGLYADAAVVGDMKGVIEDLAPHIGISIRAMGTVAEGEAEGRKGPIVQELVQGQSIDFVTRAGAGGTIRSVMESIRGHITTAPTAASSGGVSTASSGTTTREGADMPESAQPTGDAAKLAEATTRAARLEEALAIRDARDFAREAVARTTLPDVTRERIVQETSANPPMKDGALDREAFKARVEEKVRAETEYLARLTGSGQVRGLGETTRTAHDFKDGEFAKRLEEGFVAIGMPAAEAKHAAKGRD